MMMLHLLNENMISDTSLMLMCIIIVAVVCIGLLLQLVEFIQILLKRRKNI